MSADPAAPTPSQAPAPQKAVPEGADPGTPPGWSGCIGIALGFFLIVALWMSISFALFTWVGEAAGAAAFFIPVLGFFLWKMTNDSKKNAKP